MSNLEQKLDAIEELDRILGECEDNLESFYNYIYCYRTKDVFVLDREYPEDWEVMEYIATNAQDQIIKQISYLRTMLCELSKKTGQRVLFERVREYLESPNNMTFKSFTDKDGQERVKISINTKSGGVFLEVPKEESESIIGDLHNIIGEYK